MTRVYVVNLGRKYLYLQWTDAETGRKLTRSSKCKTRRDAERKAQILENQLSIGDRNLTHLKWKDFVERYQMEHLSGLATKTEVKSSGVLMAFYAAMHPAHVSGVTSTMLSKYVTAMRTTGKSESTIAGHVRQLRAALSWARSQGLIGSIPAMPRIQRASGSRIAKGRPISLPEMKRLIRATRNVTGCRWRSWSRLLRGLWLSGLRLGEAVQLRWEPGNWPHVSGEWLMIPASFDKAHRDRIIPLPYDLVLWLNRTPETERAGKVFRPLGERGNECKFFRVSQIISQIGKAANVVTDPATGRTCTAHDIRRAFAQRWASKLTAVDLQRIMRHESITTTLGYYLDEDAKALSERMKSTFLLTHEKK